jgi:methionyl-tRNA synthetase
MPEKTFYLTTPIYYINATPHIGHAYTQIAADARARFERLRGRRVFFLTGTDEHGVKVARAAEELGRDVQTHADDLSAQFRKLWDALGITYDDYIRTTEPRHKKVAQAVVQKLWDGGHLSLGTYSGWYSVPDETFFRTEDTVERDGSHYIATPSEDQSRAPLEWVEETTHFFKLSSFESKLKEFYAAHPEVLQPDSRRNETLSFINSGLRDVSISRELEWGIPIPTGVPHHEKHSIYVWFEALLNYLSAPGYLSADPARRDLFDSAWPPDLQLMSKDIFTRFHATLWPSILTALDVPLPKQLFAHGFWTVDGQKMSKRYPETIIEPLEFAQEIATRANCELTTAIDALRYYCLREVTFGADGDFSRDGCLARYNSDLANGLGNLVNRALSMLTQYFEGVVPSATGSLGLKEAALQSTAGVETAYANLDYSGALNQIWEIVGQSNRVIEEQKPWAKIKSGEQEAVALLLGELLSVCQWCAITLNPVMPHVTVRLLKLLGLKSKARWADAETLSAIGPGHQCLAPEPLFPRINTKAATAPAKAVATPQKGKKAVNEPQSPNSASIPEVTPAVTNEATGGNVDASTAAQSGTAPDTTAPTAPAAATDNADSAAATTPEPSYIDYADFAKVQLRTGRVLEAERVPKADKLLRLQVDLGSETRQILAGIAQQFEPESLIGKTVVVVANLAPRKLRGFESQGMLLAASESDDSPAGGLLTVDADLPPGSIVR